jgi:hypothetical protein
MKENNSRREGEGGRRGGRREEEEGAGQGDSRNNLWAKNIDNICSNTRDGFIWKQCKRKPVPGKNYPRSIAHGVWLLLPKPQLSIMYTDKVAFKKWL